MNSELPSTRRRHPRTLADRSATARDLTLEAARDAGPRRNTKALPAAQIKKMLDSKHEREVLDGLRKVVAVGQDHELYIPEERYKLIISNVDAICQSSATDSHFLSCRAQDLVESIPINETTGIQLLNTSCRSGSGYCVTGNQYDTEVAV